MRITRARTAAERARAATALAWLASAAIISAILPVLAGLAFLISLAARRPLITAAAQRWPWLASNQPGQAQRRAQVGLTAAWGVAMLAVGAVQAVGAMNGSLGITSPATFAVRALIALGAEAVLAVITVMWLRRKPPARPQHPANR